MPNSSGTPTDAPNPVGDPALPPSLRFLKWLVIILTLTMIGGVITVVGLLVTRMPQAFSAPSPRLPDGFILPEGATAEAVTFGTGWIAVVTTDDRILIFGKDGRLRQDVAITP
jgi:Flp pilus assembly protein protease CpaA